jgi:hypothetical protein
MSDFQEDEEATPTNPDGGRILVSSAAGAALDGPVPDEVFVEGNTARVRIDPTLMPEVASVINAERVTERNHVLGAMVDVLIADGMAPARAVAVSRNVLALLAKRRKEALRQTILGHGPAISHTK